MVVYPNINCLVCGDILRLIKVQYWLSFTCYNIACKIIHSYSLIFNERSEYIKEELSLDNKNLISRVSCEDGINYYIVKKDKSFVKMPDIKLNFIDLIKMNKEDYLKKLNNILLMS